MRSASGRRAILPIALLLLLLCVLFHPAPATAKPPDVLILYPVDGATYRASELVTLDASESFDPDGRGITVHWKSNKDGDLGYGEVVMVKLSSGGHTITCTVTDEDGESDSDTRKVTILPLEPPIARLDADKMDVEVFEIVTFDGSRSTDPDFGITEFKFWFGDGKDSGWIKSNISSHSYNIPGVYKARLEVKDNDGLKDSTNQTITVRGRTKVQDDDSDFIIFLLLILMVVVIALFIMIMAFRRIRRKRVRLEEEQLRRRIERKTRMARKKRGEAHPSKELVSARKVKQPKRMEGAEAKRKSMRTGSRMTDLGPRTRKR